MPILLLSRVSMTPHLGHQCPVFSAIICHFQALLASCGWPSVQSSEAEDEELGGLHFPGFGPAARSRSMQRHAGKRVEGLALIATQSIQDGEHCHSGDSGYSISLP